jgi:predicted TIM-barrel fold metal-dependent hydrolase
MSVIDVDVNREIERAERVAPFVIDADAHVNPPPTMWSEYLAPQFRASAPVIESDGEFDYVVFEGTRRKVNLLSAQAGRKFDQYKQAGRLSDMRLGGWMAPQRIEDMDRDGIDIAVQYGGGPLGSSNMDLYLESFSAYNRWVADFCSHDPKRLKYMAYLPTVDVDQTVALMKEAKKAGAVGVNIPAFPLSKTARTGFDAQSKALSGDADGPRQYRDAEFDPIWKTACDLDMPITVHLGARVPRFTDKKNFLTDVAMSKLAMLEVAGIFTYGAIFDRFPALRFGMIEAGAGWLAWAATYMDRTWEMQHHWTECEILHPPSYYFDQNIYASFISDPVAVMLRHLPGCKNIMWSSDYPHSETTFPTSQQTIASNFSGVPEADRDWIIAGCAQQFFGI